jgi:deoxyadenosine/deoxycytidine kinase
MFSMNKAYAENLQRKIDVFVKYTKTKKQIFMAMISANGLKQNQYAAEMISAVATLEDLFKTER